MARVALSTDPSRDDMAALRDEMIQAQGRQPSPHRLNLWLRSNEATAVERELAALIQRQEAIAAQKPTPADTDDIRAIRAWMKGLLDNDDPYPAEIVFADFYALMSQAYAESGRLHAA